MLEKKIRIATILGTYQATLSDYKYISDEWRKNQEDEYLLGVSITGQWDCETVRDPDVLKHLRDMSVLVNMLYAKRFEIGQSNAIPCVKPSGSVSVLVNSASGVNPRFGHNVRNVRISSSDPLSKMMTEEGIHTFQKMDKRNLETKQRRSS